MRCIRPFVPNAAKNVKSPLSLTRTGLSIVANAIATRDRRDDLDDTRRIDAVIISPLLFPYTDVVSTLHAHAYIAC